MTLRNPARGSSGPSRLESTTAGESGGSAAPIQNTRYWDPSFSGTSDGSIGAPYTLLAPLFAEIAAGEEGWQVYLPGVVDLTPDASVPALSDGVKITFRGMHPEATVFGAPFVIAAQTMSPYIDFHDVWFSELSLLGGVVNMVFNNCYVDDFTFDASSACYAGFRDCQITGLTLPYVASSSTVEFWDGSLTGGGSWTNGRFYNSYLNGTFTLGDGQTRIVGCRFGGSIAFATGEGTPLIEMDAYSYARFREAGGIADVTVIGTIETLEGHGSQNVSVDLLPSVELEGTLATAATVNFDVPIAAGRRYGVTADVWVDNGAGGACLLAKALYTVAHQTGGVAVKVVEQTIHDSAGAGFAFTSAVSTTNIRYSLANTSGTLRSYNLVIGVVSLDKP